MAWQVGQRVVVEFTSIIGGRQWSIQTIERVTPSGRAVVGPAQYLPDGRLVGGSSGYRIRLATPEDEAGLERRQLQIKVAQRVTLALRKPWPVDLLRELEGMLDRAENR